MTLQDDGSITPMPDSPPDLTGSKSSKTSSFHSSFHSDDNSIFDGSAHFEEIGLDDESRTEADVGVFAVASSPNPYDAKFASDLRATAKQRKQVPMSTIQRNRSQRELISSARPHPRGLARIATDGLGLMPSPNGASRRGMSSPSPPSSFPGMKRNRSSSPNFPTSSSQGVSAGPLKPRRGSWQSINRERKTAVELEKECDEDDGDDVPDECLLENVPISPRPPQERSRPSSTATSPERPPKERARTLGNGTSPKPAEQGEFRSPKPGINRVASMGQFPITHDTFSKARAKSWTAALSELSEEAKALTEALEAHAEDEEKKEDPRQRRSFSSHNRTPEKPRVKSAIAELPPLRRTDIMIDPLPISKEKEAVLSRTRPSWLPPKDPAEEKRHLKEYQRMMALSLEAERKKEADKQTQLTCRDDTASSLLRIWEEHVLPNWDTATRHKRTRELWWRGIAPRSRGDVWIRAVGNELGLTETSYTAALRRAQALETTIKRGSQLSADEERKKGWLDKIEAAAGTTYPELKIFQPHGPLHNGLLDVLKAYAMYRSDVGYVHGCSTIAALLLLNLPTPSSAFITLSNILNRPLPLSFHTNDTGGTTRAYALVLQTVHHNSPRLHALLTSAILPRRNFGNASHLNADSYLHLLFTSLFTANLNLDNASRLWDIVVFEGDAVFVRAGAAYLLALEGKLLGAGSAAEVGEIIKGGLGDLSEDDWIRAVKAAGRP